MALEDMMFIYVIFEGSLISYSFGKLRAPSLVMLIKRLIKVGPGFPIMPGDGISLCLWPSPWLTITERCWPGVPELHSFEASRF